MKKSLFIISLAALALASCAKFESENEVTYETADAPTVKVEVTGDNSVYVEVLPGSNTGYYAYALYEGEVEAAAIDASTLLAGKAGGIKSEVSSVAKKDTLKANVASLSSNTQYTVVAVASSKGTQSLSEVVAKTVLTTDETVPDIEDYDYEVDGKDLTYYVLYDDPITLTDTAKFFVRTFAKNYDGGAPSYILQPVKQVEIPVANVSIARGSIVVISVPDDGYAPNAYTALYIKEGSVKNALNGVNEAFVENSITVRGKSSDTYGLLAQYESEEFEFESPFAADSVFKFQDPADVAVELTPKFVGYANEFGNYGTGDVNVTAINPVSGRKVEYALKNWDIDATGTKVVLGVDETPDFGNFVNFSVEAGIVEDLYGNTNKALDIENNVFRSYGYSLSDVLGVYDYQFYANSSGSYETGQLVLEASDEIVRLGDNKEYACNVKFTKYFNITLANPLYAVFDADAGSITIPDWQTLFAQPVYANEEDTTPSDYYVYIYSTYNNPATKINVPSAGVLDGFDDTAFGMAVYQNSTQARLGFIWYLSYYAERTAAPKVTEVKAVSAPVKKQAFAKGVVDEALGKLPSAK